MLSRANHRLVLVRDERLYRDEEGKTEKRSDADVQLKLTWDWTWKMEKNGAHDRKKKRWRKAGEE